MHKIDWTTTLVWALLIVFCAAFYYGLAVLIPALVTAAER